MGCFYLLHDNFIPRSDTYEQVNSISFTSNQAPFGTGIYSFSGMHRSRPWRTDGHFKVESGSNTIIIRETVGVDITATVAVGTYTTRASFLAAVQTALNNSVGASTYTVSIDTSLLTKIVSNGVGGGGLCQLMWTDPLSATMASFLGFSTSTDSTGALTYYADTVSIHQYEALTLDLGVPLLPKAFLMVGPSNGQMQLTDSCTVKLQGSHTTDWDSAAYEVTIPYHPTAMMAVDVDGLPSEAYRYWRVLFIDPTNPAGYLDIYPIYLGDIFAPARGGVQFPLNTAINHYTDLVRLSSGNVSGKKANFGASWEINYSALTAADVEDLTAIFKTFGMHRSLFIVGDLNAVYTTEAEVMARMVKFTENPRHSLESPGFYSMNFILTEEI